MATHRASYSKALAFPCRWISQPMRSRRRTAYSPLAAGVATTPACLWRASTALPHGHSYDSAGEFGKREWPMDRNYRERSFTVGIGGPVGSGKTALVRELCMAFKQYNIAVVTNDIFTREDAEFLLRHQVLPEDRVEAVETGGCPHAAIREDVSANLAALESLTARHATDFLLLESGGDNLAANFSRELADLTV